MPEQSAVTSAPTDVLVVGATGSIGALVVEEALRQGLRTRALIRDGHRAASVPPTTIIDDFAIGLAKRSLQMA